MRIDDLIGQLQTIFASEGKQKLEDNPELLRLIEGIGIRVDAKNVGNIANLIQRLEYLKATIDEKELEERITKLQMAAEEKLENARVPEGVIRRLVKEYEERLEEGLTHEKAIERVAKDNRDLVTKKNVENFLRRQNEIYERMVETLERESGLGKEEISQIAKAVASQQLLEEVETTQARAVVEGKTEVIARELIEKLNATYPNEVDRNKVELKGVIDESIAKHITGNGRVEEGFMSIREAEEILQKRPPRLSEQIVKVLDLPPSKTAAAARAVGKANLVATGWSEDKTRVATKAIIAELTTTSDAELSAGAKVYANKIEETAAREIEVAVTSGRGFDQVSEKVAAVLDSHKRVAVESAVEKALKIGHTSGVAGEARIDWAIEVLEKELSKDPDIAARLSSAGPEFESAVRPRILDAVVGRLFPEERIEETPSLKNLTERIAGVLRVPHERMPEVNMAVKNAGLSVDQLILSDKNDVKRIRAERIRSEIDKGFATVNGKLTAEQLIAVHSYTKLVADFNSDVDLDAYKKEAMEFAEGRGNRPGVVKNAWNDVAGISKIIQMSPERLKLFQEKYFQLKNGLLGLKIPVGVPELRSLEGLMKLTREVPEIGRLLAFAQKFTNFYSSVNNLTTGLLQRIGLEKFGGAILEKIGGQAMGAFVKHSLAVLAEHGTQRGLMMILNGVLAGGVQAGATGGVGVTGLVAVFQAIPVVGQVILVGALAISAVKKITDPIFDKIKRPVTNFISKIGLETKQFFQENLGEGLGWVVDKGFKIGLFLVAIPVFLTGIIAATMVTQLIAGVFIGLFSLFFATSTNMSALVPRGAPRGGEVYDYGDGWKDPYDPNQLLPTRDPNRPISNSCPEIWPTGSGIIVQGPSGSYTHSRLQAIDIVVGPVPIMATHDGAATTGGGRDGNYGYFVDVAGTCQGKTITTRYAHMPGWLISDKPVKQGDIIGYVGNTGKSTESHLHYEFLTGQKINDWLPKPVPVGCDYDSHPCGMSIP